MKIDELKFDDKNFNKHTEYGMSLLEKYIKKQPDEDVYKEVVKIFKQEQKKAKRKEKKK